MSFEALISVSKKRSKPYNLALKVVNTTGQNFSFTCSNHSKPADFKYGFTEDNISLTPAVAASGAERTTYIIPVLANAQKLYIYFPEPVVKTGSFLQMTSNSYVTEVLFWDKFPQERIAFSGWAALSKVPTTTWNACRDMTGMFGNCTAFNQALNWNTSAVTSMNSMFYGCVNFNQPLIFNTANVHDMSTMFYVCYAFNQPIIFGDVSKVRSMGSMFVGAKVFNQDLSGLNFKATTERTDYDSGTTAWIPANKPKFTA